MNIQTFPQIQEEIVKKIYERYTRIAKSLIMDFWQPNSSFSAREFCFFVGSYGRGTSIDASDVDILIRLPKEDFDRFNNYQNNGQSSLLQKVKNAIQDNDSRLADVSGDGQVVVINFCDKITFEILPAFKTTEGKYIYPDSNNGGRWRSTDPIREQEAMFQRNVKSKNLLFDTCKSLRKIRNDLQVDLSGILIDSFTYNAIRGWSWGGNSSNAKESNIRFKETLLQEADRLKNHLVVPGSGDIKKIDDSEKKQLMEILECV